MHKVEGCDGALVPLILVYQRHLGWCILTLMTRITDDVNDEWLNAAKEILGTETKVATINAALRSFALRTQASKMVAALDSVAMDFTDSHTSWRYGAGRDLTRLEEGAREPKAV